MIRGREIRIDNFKKAMNVKGEGIRQMCKREGVKNRKKSLSIYFIGVRTSQSRGMINFSSILSKITEK